MKKVILVCLLSCLSACSDELDREVVITIDESMTYQTMEGFGGFGGKEYWWKDGPYFDGKFIDLLINDLGLTVLRDNIPISFEPENDNADPSNVNISGFNLAERTGESDSVLNSHFAYLKAMHEAGLEKLIVSVWSPPLWMKHNGARGNGTARGYSAPRFNTTPGAEDNQLKEEFYEEFAEYCVAYIRLLKTHTDIDLYALSIQNEPRFSQFYPSAVYSPEAYARLLSIVGKRFRQEGISTYLFGPEDVASFPAINRYLEEIALSPDALLSLGAIAIHNYASKGVRPRLDNRENWRKTKRIANKLNKRLWMTETSGFQSGTMAEGLRLAYSIYDALYYGGVSMWVFWYMANSFFVDGVPTYKYLISKHFYRHVRSGYVRVFANSSNNDVQVLAFNNSNGKKVVIVLNMGSENYVLNFKDFWLGKKFDVWVTSDESSYKLVPDGSLQTLLKAQSLMTFESI